MGKISAVYKIVNTVTGDFYIGSSVDVMRRWKEHRALSTWKQYPNSLLYKSMQEYGLDKFRFQILAPVMEEYLKQVEQEFIELLKPTYNNYNAKGWNIERIKAAHKKSKNKYSQSEKGKLYQKKYRQSGKGKESHKKSNKKYDNQLCEYNGETLTLCALRARFQRAGISHSTQEAKKYLV